MWQVRGGLQVKFDVDWIRPVLHVARELGRLGRAASYRRLSPRPLILLVPQESLRPPPGVLVRGALYGAHGCRVQYSMYAHYVCTYMLRNPGRR